jgi:hypothetical protein
MALYICKSPSSVGVTEFSPKLFLFGSPSLFHKIYQHYSPQIAIRFGCSTTDQQQTHPNTIALSSSSLNSKVSSAIPARRQASVLSVAQQQTQEEVNGCSAPRNNNKKEERHSQRLLRHRIPTTKGTETFHLPIPIHHVQLTTMHSIGNRNLALAMIMCIVQTCCLGTSHAFFVPGPSTTTTTTTTTSSRSVVIHNIQPLKIPTSTTSLYSFSYLGNNNEGNVTAASTGYSYSNPPQGGVDVTPPSGSAAPSSMDTTMSRPGGGPAATGKPRPSSSSSGVGVSGPPIKAGSSSSTPPRSPPAPKNNPIGGQIKDIWNTLKPTVVQGGSLRTWSFQTEAVQRVSVFLKTEGRPLNADVDLWQGPDNAPEKIRVYLEDGDSRTFSAVLETPRGSNAVAVRNTGHLEFPLEACVEANLEATAVNQRMSEQIVTKTIQGGAIKTYPFSPTVQNVLVLLATDGRPLNARIELLQGPNNNKQVVEVYTEDGKERPFFMVIDTPGIGNVVRIVNTAPVEFPMTCAVESYPYESSLGSEDTINTKRGPAWENGGTNFFLG